MTSFQQGIPVDPQQYVPPLVSAATTVVIFVVTSVIIYFLGKHLLIRVVKGSLRRRNFDETLVSLVVSTAVVGVAVLSVALAATVAGFGVVLAAFATLGGALALAVGFAAKDLIANFVAGVFIIQDEPFAIGDWIEWGDNSGVVRDVQLRVTKLDTFDNQLVTVPNSHLANAAVINNMGNGKLRMSVDFGIGYEDDVDRARESIIDEGADIDDVLAEPAPKALVTGLGDSAVVLQGRIWIDPEASSYGAVRAQFVKAVKQRFDSEGIDIPYPNTELSGDIAVTDVSEDGEVTGD